MSTITEIVMHDSEDKLMIGDITEVKLVDEGGGRFVTVTQLDENHNELTLRFDPKEIQFLVEIVQMLLAQE